MNQEDLDALEACGLRPIVIDENFDYSQLGKLLGLPEKTDEQVDKRTTQTTFDPGQRDLFPPS